MKHFAITLTLVVALGSSHAQDAPPEEGVPFNKVIYFNGTPENEYYDPYMYVRYTGIPEFLLEEASKAHDTPITYNTNTRQYDIRNTNEPLWYYANYRVYIKYTRDGLYKIWASYDGMPSMHPDRTHDSMIMQDIARDWTGLYQGIVDRAMARSIQGER
ncbi:MAG: hypothetical protein RLP15_07785 [Cryomorphaceae bacterium]